MLLGYRRNVRLSTRSLEDLVSLRRFECRIHQNLQESASHLKGLALFLSIRFLNYLTGKLSVFQQANVLLKSGVIPDNPHVLRL